MDIVVLAVGIVIGLGVVRVKRIASFTYLATFEGPFDLERAGDKRDVGGILDAEMKDEVGGLVSEEIGEESHGRKGGEVMEYCCLVTRWEGAWTDGG